MIDAVVTVAEREQKSGTQGPYLRVVTHDDKGKQWTYNIFDQADWNMWQVNAVLKIEYEISGNFRNIKSAEVVTEDALAQQMAQTQIRATEPAPQELGMFWKELGMWLRLWEQKPKAERPKNYEQIKTLYFAQMWSVLPIKSSKKEE